MNRTARWFAPIVLAALAVMPLTARAQLQVIETDDLRLSYPAPLLSYIAPYTVKCFENSMRFHRKLWNYQPSERINVMLDDFTDYGNAGVWVNPRNSMVFHVAPSSFVYETGPSNERINFTMNHEVVHVLALDAPGGADRAWRRLFHGKVRETSEHPETILYGHLVLPRRAAHAGTTKASRFSWRLGWPAGSGAPRVPMTRWCSAPWCATARTSTIHSGWKPRA